MSYPSAFQFRTNTADTTGTSAGLNYETWTGTAAGMINAGDRIVTNQDLQIEPFHNTDTTAGTFATQRYRFQTSPSTADFRISSTDRFNFSGGFSDYGSLKNALMQIFKKVPKDLAKSADDKLLVKAKEKSEKLLKSWLSPKEYQGLMNKGSIEIPSKELDVIFIVKKDPNEMVDVIKRGSYSHKLCLVADNIDMPVGDQLLSKIALLKTNEKQFKEIAIRHG